MREIVGNTIATPNPCPDWNQTDATKADYIKNKPDYATLVARVESLEEQMQELYAQIEKLTTDV